MPGPGVPAPPPGPRPAMGWQGVAVMRLVDESASERALECIEKTWAAIQTGAGKFRRAKRSLTTYRDTNVKTTGKLDVTEALIGIGTGIAIGVLSSAVLAASVGTLGAVPIALAIGFVVALLSKAIFNAIRSTRAKNKALAALETFETSGVMPDPKVEDDDLAAAFLKEMYKDIIKIDALKKKIENGGAPLVNLRARFAGIGQGHGKLSTNYGITKRPKFPPEYELGSRLKRVTLYDRWLRKYYGVLHMASVDLSGDDFTKLEEWVMGGLVKQMKITGNHVHCGDDFCYGPGTIDLRTRPMSDAEMDAVRKRAEQTHRTRVFQTEKQIRDAARAQAPVNALSDQLDVAEGHWTDPVKEQGLASVVDLSQSVPIAIFTNSDIVGKFGDPIADAVIGSSVKMSTQAFGAATNVTAATVQHAATGAAASGAAFAPIGFLVGKSFELAVNHWKTNKPVSDRVGKLRSVIRTHETEAEIRIVFEQILKGLDEKMAMRCLVKASRHYPRRIKERLEKLKSQCESMQGVPNGPDQSPFSSCAQAQAFVRYVLKVHHYVDKQLAHVAILEVLSMVLEKRAYHEQI